MTTLADLVKPGSAEAELESLLAVFALLNFPTASWDEVSVGRVLSQGFAHRFASASSLVADIAKGGLVDLAEGDWLTLLAADRGVARKPAQFALRRARLVDAGGGPYTVVPGQLTASASGLYFTNVEGGTLAQGGTLTLTWKAQEAGAKYNVPPDAAASLLTPLPQVTVVDLGVSESGGSPGSDEETDPSLRVRTKAVWNAMGGGATRAAVAAWALGAHAEVKQVRVKPPTGDGVVRVVVAGDGAPVDPNVVDAVYDALELRMPLTVGLEVTNAVVHPVAVSAALKVAAVHAGGVVAAAQLALLALQRELDIGEGASLARVVEALMKPDGMSDVVIATPTGMSTPPSNGILVFSPVTLSVVAL